MAVYQQRPVHLRGRKPPQLSPPQVDGFTANRRTTHLQVTSLQHMTGKQQAMDHTRLTRTVRAKDEPQRSDGNPLCVGKCFEVTEAKSSEYLTYHYSE
ncbi:MAG TPA: hypothetical protein VNN62_15645 [Methylomirabilota bacterium]|jgi:hypothetical protein|nr:hypothetical protein [Methylomirabilota bacterium]